MGHIIHSPPMAQSPTSSAITIPIKARSHPEAHTEDNLTTPPILSRHPHPPSFNSRHQMSPLHIPNNQSLKPPAKCEKRQPDSGKASARHVLPSNTLPSNSRHVQDLSDAEDEEEDECEVDRQKEHAAFIFVRHINFQSPPFPCLWTHQYEYD